MGINISGFGSLKFGTPVSRQVPWGGNQPIREPASVADARRIVYDLTHTANSWVPTDNRLDDSWGPDLEYRLGRVFRAREPVAIPDLKGGVLTPALSLDFDPNNGNQLVSFDMTSKEGNFSKHITWRNGEFESCQEERLLANGDKEVLSLQVDPVTDTMTYITDIIKPGATG